jgi:hypothetical protein
MAASHKELEEFWKMPESKNVCIKARLGRAATCGQTQKPSLYHGTTRCAASFARLKDSFVPRHDSVVLQALPEPGLYQGTTSVVPQEKQ